MLGFVKVCKLSDIVNGRYLALVNGLPIAVFVVDGNFYAVANRCAHMGGPLVDGTFDKDGYIVCPWHGYQYDPKTGKAPPGFSDRVDAYEVKIDGEDVFVAVEPLEKTPIHPEFSILDRKTRIVTKATHEPWMCIICREEYSTPTPPASCWKCLANSDFLLAKAQALKTFKIEDLTKPTYNIEEKHVVDYLQKHIVKREFSERRLAMWRDLAQQPPIDALIISASAHPQHIVSGYIAPKIIERIRTAYPDLTYDWIDLARYRIEHNWACYSLADDDCRFPCNNMEDDMRHIYPKLIKAKSLMIATPINWENMNSRLKVFLDRLTNLQDIPLKEGHVDWAGRPVGVFVNGHEDGAYKVAWDVFVVLQNLGYVLAPYGIWYNLQSLADNTNTDLREIRQNDLALFRLQKVVDNVINFMKLRVDKQLHLEPEGEKLRKVHYVAM